MKFNQDYMRRIMGESYEEYLRTAPQDETPMSEDEFLEFELEHNPESFNCFFERSWDELSNSELAGRKSLILNIFD